MLLGHMHYKPMTKVLVPLMGLATAQDDALDARVLHLGAQVGHGFHARQLRRVRQRRALGVLLEEEVSVLALPLLPLWDSLQLLQFGSAV